MSKARQQANLSSDGNLFADISNDRVGVGSVVPTHKLHVNGTSKFDDDVKFEGTTAARNIEWDKSADTLNFSDSTKLKFGDSGDLEILHDGSQTSYVQSIGTARDLVIKADRFVKIARTTGGAIGFQMHAGNEVGLYHGGNKKINTTTTGAKVTGNLEVTGVLTYEDVTSVDSVGIVTARQGIHIDDSITHIGDTNTKIRFPSNDTITFETSGNEAFRIDSNRISTFKNKIIIDDGSNGHLFLNNTSTDNTIHSGTTGFAAYKNLVINAAQHIFKISNTEKLRITSGGQVNIGGNYTQTSNTLNVTGNIKSTTRFNAGDAVYLWSQNRMSLGNSFIIESQQNTPFAICTQGVAQPIVFGTGTAGGAAVEHMRLDSGGRLLIGHTASQSVYSTSALQIQGTSAATSSVSLLRQNGSPYLSLGATGGGTKGGSVAVSSGDRLGQLTFVGADGTDVNTHACSISGYCDGNVSGNVVPGRLVFKCSTGAGEPERMRITSAGLVGIGNDSPSELLSLRHASSNTVLDFECLAANDGSTGNIIKFRGKGANGTSYHAAQIKGITENGANNAGFLSFWTNSAGTVAEKLRITSAGRIGIGVATPGCKLNVKASGSESDGLQVTSSGHSSYVWQIQNNDNLFNGSLAGELGIRGSSGIAFSANAGTSTHLRINSAGDVLLGTNQATIGCNTADGSDNRSFNLCGGSDASQSRGAVITIYGNEADNGSSQYGVLSLKSGNTSTGNINFWTQGTERLHIQADGLKEIKNGRLRITSTFIDFSGNISTPSTGSAIFRPASDTLAVSTNNAERLRITSDGEIRCVGAADNKGFAVYLDGTRRVSELIEHSSDGELRLYTGEATPVLRTVITSYGDSYINASGTGTLLVGHSGSVDVGSSAYGRFQVHTSNTIVNTALAGYGNNSGGAILSLGHSRHGTVGSTGVAVQANDNLGEIRFAGDDGTDLETTACQIIGAVDGSVSGNTIPGRLEFWTGSTKAYVVNSSGNVAFGHNGARIQTNSSGWHNYMQGGATNPGGAIRFSGGNSDGDLRFYAQGQTATLNERARIAANGTFTIYRSDSTDSNAWSTIEYGDNDGLRRHVRYISAGASTATINLFRARRHYWGEGHYKITLKQNYYVGTSEANWWLNGHGRNSGSFSPSWSMSHENENSSIGSSTIQCTAASNSSPGNDYATYTDVYATVSAYNHFIVVLEMSGGVPYSTNTGSISENGYALF